MIRFKTIEQIIKERHATSKQCDRCNKDYNDEFDMQEFHHIRFTGGYGSVFGDGDRIECDICQHCLKLLIDKYYRIIPEIDI